MLLYHRPVPAKIPKRRSRAGCVHCKEKKKKCNEERPSCDRCLERGLRCEYEPVKPRKRRRTVSNPEHIGHMRPPTTNPGSHFGAFHDRLQALRQDSSSGSSGFTGSPTPPLPAIAENWEVHSAHSVFSDSASSCGSESFADMNSPLPPFDSLDNFARSQAELTEVKPIAMESLDGFAKSPYDEDLNTSREMFTPNSALARSSSYPDPTTAFLSPNSSGSPYDFSVPAFSEYTTRESQRGLLDHFCNVLSHLIVYKEDSGNPFRQLILPMAQKSPPLLNAIYAISSAHLEHRGLHVEERALDLHSKALQGLANLIAHKDEGNRDEVLAVIILLLYYEIVRLGSSTVLNSHLRGALHIMRERRTKRPSPTFAFLERAFRYFDVTSALSFGSSPMSGTILMPQPHDYHALNERSAMACVDTLFGLVADLWPIMHRLASLVDVKRSLDKEEFPNPNGEEKSAVRTDFENNTANIDIALHQWVPKLPASVTTIETPADDSRLQSVLINAEAHRQACFIFLNRTLLGNARSSPKVQTPVKQALQACLRVVIFSGPMAGLVWPLFTAAVEAVEEVDRNVAKTVFQHLEQRQGMGNIMTAWEVCIELWRRSDLGQGELNWRDVAHEMNREVIFG